MSKWSERYSKVITAVRHGKLKRPNDSVCQECGALKAHKHHDDYAKPLEVMYLCRTCHRKRHKELNWGIGGRVKGKWKYNLRDIPIGGFVFIETGQPRMSSYLNSYKRKMLPGSDFKSFSFETGVIVFRTK